jgi:hypothetical protein
MTFFRPQVGREKRAVAEENPSIVLVWIPALSASPKSDKNHVGLLAHFGDVG